MTGTFIKYNFKRANKERYTLTANRAVSGELRTPRMVRGRDWSRERVWERKLLC